MKTKKPITPSASLPMASPVEPADDAPAALLSASPDAATANPFAGLYDAGGNHLVGAGPAYGDALAARPSAKTFPPDAAEPALILAVPLDGSALPMGAVNWLADAFLLGAAIAVRGPDDAAVARAEQTIEAALRARAAFQKAADDVPADTAARLAWLQTLVVDQQAQIRALAALLGGLTGTMQARGLILPEVSQAAHGYAQAVSTSCASAMNIGAWGRILSLAQADEAAMVGGQDAAVVH